MHRPDQSEAAAFGTEHIAQQAVKNIGRVDHQTLDPVEADLACAFGNAFRQAVELLVHGLAPREVGLELGPLKRSNLGPAGEVFFFHVQRRQKGRTLRIQPNPQVAVFHITNQIGQGALGLEIVPRQPRA